MSDHSILSPSGAHIWVNCPGAVLAQLASPPQERSEAATQGDLVHSLGAKLIDQGRRGIFPSTLDHACQAPEYDDDMRRAATGYSQAVVKCLQGFRVFGGDSMGIETRVEIPWIHQTMFGTCDAWVYSAEFNELVIWDLKYGYRVVEPVNNWQLICYAAGLIDRIKYKGGLKISFRIYQPRAPHELGVDRRWNTTWDAIQPQCERLQKAAIEALGDSPTTTAGAHCRDCKARFTCPTLSKEAIGAAEYLGRPVPTVQTPEAISTELTILERAKRLVENRLDALHTQIISSGTCVPGYAVQPGRGSTVWALPTNEIVARAAAEGINVTKPVVFTPRQAALKGFDQKIIDSLTKKIPGKLKVKPVTGARAQMIFGGLERE